MRRSYVSFVDDFIAAQKTISGVPEWNPTEHNRREIRLLMPLAIDGASTGGHLEIKAYPLSHPLRYRIMLILEKCVCRIDHVYDEGHTNSFNRAADITEYSFREPHYHSWPDNKRFCSKFGLPDELHNARLLPENLRSFDSALRWFCGETNIAQPPAGLIDLPPRTMLL